jgi:hypothetical protein
MALLSALFFNYSGYGIFNICFLTGQLRALVPFFAHTIFDRTIFTQHFRFHNFDFAPGEAS